MKQTKGRKKNTLFRICCTWLCILQLALGLSPVTVQAETSAASDILMEEYDNVKDYTGWYTVYVKVLDDVTGEPVEGIYVTLNSKEKGNAGHGPNINGITEYMTDRDGMLEFRIYPSPVTYAAIVASGQKGYAALEQYVGAIKEDKSVITLRLKKESPTPAPTATPKPDNTDKGNNDNNNSTPTPTVTPTATPIPTVKPGIKPTPKPDKTTKDEYIIPGPDKELGTEDDITVKPGKDDKGNNNSSIDKDGKVDLPDGGELIVPTIPDKGDISIKVPEGTVVDPDGKLNLPDKNQQTEIILPGKDTILGTEDDVIVRPGLDDKGKNTATIDRDGTVKLPDGGDVILPTLPDIGDICVKVPEGTKVSPDGTITLPDKNQQTEIILPGKDKVLGTEDDLILTPNLDDKGKNNTTIDETGKVTLPDGGRVTFPSFPDMGRVGVELPAGSTITPDGVITVPAGTKKGYILPGKDALLDTDDDVIVEPSFGSNGNDNSYIMDDGSVYLPDGGTVTYADGTVIEVPGGTIVLPDGTIIYPANAKAGMLDFWDCLFHWFEFVILLLLILLLLTRLHWLKRRGIELEDIAKIGWVDRVDPKWLAQTERKQKKTGIVFYSIWMSLAVLCAILFYFIAAAHCVVDLPLLVVLVIVDIIFLLMLANRESALKNLIAEHHSDSHKKEKKSEGTK